METTVFLSRQKICRMLHELGIPVHRVGYKYLILAIHSFGEDDGQSLTKGLYPNIALHFGYGDWHPVEHAIRLVILYAWENRLPGVWEQYFPCARRCPSNKLFIATMAEFLQM